MLGRVAAVGALVLEGRELELADGDGGAVVGTAAANDSMTSTPGTVRGAASASCRAVTACPVRARTVSTTHRDGSSARWPTGSARGTS